jgi:polyisoprenoid-binding protein YceI
MRTQTLLIAAALAMTTTLAACESEVDNKPAAKVVEADDKKGADTKADDKADDKAGDKADDKAADNGAATAGAAGTFAVAPDKSSIDWVGAKVTGDHKGGFKTFTGELTVADGKVTALTFDVDTTSIWSDTDMLTGHLKGPDFFDVEKFPKAAFKATKVEAKAEGDHTHVITGEMDLHGVKKTIAFPATVKVEADKVTANTEFTLKRFDFGIDYKGKANDLIKEDVLLKIKFEAPKKG